MRNKDREVDRLNDEPGMTGLEEAGDHVPSVGSHDYHGILLSDKIAE